MKSIDAALVKLACEAGFRAHYVTQDDLDLGYYAGPVGRLRWLGVHNSNGQCECPDELERFAEAVRRQALEAAAPKWIWVDDQPPAIGVRVLVAIDMEVAIARCVSAPVGDFGEWGFALERDPDGKIIYPYFWMELQQAPPLRRCAAGPDKEPT